MPRLLSLAFLIGFFCVGVIPAIPQPAKEGKEGVLPVGADGKPLNLDFETGTLKDWTAEGDAFKGQPIQGDAIAKRRTDMKSQHQGRYWIGGFEKFQDKPTGTLTSVTFKVTHPWASFLIGGGPWPETCVELVRKDTGNVFHRASGIEEENLRREVVDLKAHQGQEIFIRVVDKHTGHWGHVNFDDFRFHTEKPTFPQRKAKSPVVVGPADVFKYAGLTPEKAAAAMTVPDGFNVKLFAGEPDVHQPVAFCLDDRGRVWVAEAYSYPVRRADKDAKDRILIFEDTDGDGKFDKSTVFMEGLNLVSGIEVGHGGVWIGAAPYFMYVPLDEKTDKPAGPAKILLDGWGYQDTHETLNTFIWGPDGWLYGCHGVFTHSKVGRPGTKDNERVPINAGVWRYHPTRHEFEVFSQGTSNPWGLDFNDRGQAFIEACVIPHCYHMIQNARYERQGGNHFNPYTFADIKTIADHRHYLGANPHGGNNKSDSAGGGHAHCGTMVYLGGTWPAEYRDKMFMGNIHGRRLNMDILKPQGSGYVAGHGPDFLLANDAWARFINLRYGPDGNVYLIDWYDKQACHTGNVQIWDRTNGRIYKVSHRDAKPVLNVDLRKLSEMELVKLQTHENDWYVRHARRLLQERLNSVSRHTKDIAEEMRVLDQIAFGHPDETKRLRALWALHVGYELGRDRVFKALSDKSPYVRAWAIQLALENKQPSDELIEKMDKLAQHDPSPVVRLYLASAIQRAPLEKRWGVVSTLVRHPEDAKDHNLPLMYWYALEPLIAVDAHRAHLEAMNGEVSPVIQFATRKIAMGAKKDELNLMVLRMSEPVPEWKQLAILRGLQEGLKGQRSVPMPPAWPQAVAALSTSKNAEMHNGIQALSVAFGDVKALAALRVVLASSKSDVPARQQALGTLLAARDKELLPIVQKLIQEPAMRGSALKALANFDDAKTPEIILAVYRDLSADEKRDAVNTLASRAVYGKALLDAVAVKKVAAADVSADVIRQLRNLGDMGLDKQIGDVWGLVRTTPAERLQQIAEYKKKLSAPATTPPDLAHGRAIFAKTCQNCHVLFGIGGKVGPDITGSNRADLNYLLENILDPSAVIPKEYTASIITLASGRVVTGIVKEATPATLTVLTANETLTIPVADVESRKESAVSMMPDDQLKPMSDADVRALIGYLQSPKQVPIQATPDNAKDFFNGKDLTGWDGDPTLWKVENGEIVGKTTGLKRNNFLKSLMNVGDFRLKVQVKLTPNKENSGIQFHSVPLPDGEMKGPQADIGEGWWGKLYEESGRGLLWDKGGDKHVKLNDWNDYEVEAKGSRVRTWINGNLCVDLDDPKLARTGVIAFQLHSGGAMEVRFREVRLEVGK